MASQSPHPAGQNKLARSHNVGNNSNTSGANDQIPHLQKDSKLLEYPPTQRPSPPSAPTVVPPGYICAANTSRPFEYIPTQRAEASSSASAAASPAFRPTTPPGQAIISSTECPPAPRWEPLLTKSEMANMTLKEIIKTKRERALARERR